MKHTIYKKRFLLTCLAVTALLAACKKDFLDQKKLSVINEQAVFRDSTLSLGMVTNLYSNLGISYNQRRFSNQGLDAACDESEAVNDLTAYTYRITTGAVNSSNADKGLWSTSYSMIRAANIYLKNKENI